MVGQLPLEQPIGVRIPGGQPSPTSDRITVAYALLRSGHPFVIRMVVYAARELDARPAGAPCSGERSGWSLQDAQYAARSRARCDDEAWRRRPALYRRRTPAPW